MLLFLLCFVPSLRQDGVDFFRQQFPEESYESPRFLERFFKIRVNKIQNSFADRQRYFRTAENVDQRFFFFFRMQLIEHIAATVEFRPINRKPFLNVYLFAGDGKSGGVDHAVDGT